jgi:Rps23 Pro-64 3,4-dihydroxylase Tpa1-like proline 4-hydroxylase
MAYLDIMEPRSGSIDAAAARDKGRELQPDYVSAQPFPHIVIDDFLPAETVELCLAEFRAEGQEDAVSFDRAQERLKRQYRPDLLTGPARQIFYAFNSRPFLQILENITGIKGLIPDPYYLGGGLHEIGNGGHLSIHADFNHHKPMGVERRLNILIYLNEDWKDEYGGQLELWDRSMKSCQRSVVPIKNRCVIFNTDSTSFHGNPHPVSHPDGVTRKSIALYYYTATWDETKREHSTHFRVRPGSADKVDFRTIGRELAENLVPPLALRASYKAGRLIKRIFAR